MRVLVVGGSGFIGSNVVDKLVNKGVNVRVFDGIMPTFRKDIEYYQGSILDKVSLGFAMNGVDIVMHLAAVADVNDVYNHPIYSEEINVRGTINILEVARNANIKRIIYGSTIWVYGDTKQDFIDEETPLCAPSHLYTATKLASEYYCQTFQKLYGLDFTILRYGIPFGPRARDAGVIPVFVRKAFAGQPLTISGDGSQFRKFIYVEDLAEGNVAVIRSAAKNRVYNLDGKQKVTIKQIAETIQNVIGNVKIEYIPERPGDFPGKEISCERASKELGWEPKISFEEGIRRYIDWYKKREEQRKADWEKLDARLKT